MSGKVTRSSTRNVRKTQKRRNLNTSRKHKEEFGCFTREIFQNHISRTEKSVRIAFQLKKDFIKALQIMNDQITEEVEDCKIILKEKDDKIEVLKTEKEELKRITSSQLDNLEVEKREMKDHMLKKESMLKYYKKCLAESQAKINDRSGVSAKKYKELKLKVKSKDFEIFQKEQEKNDLRKLIDAKDEVIKMKDASINDLSQNLKEQQEQMLSFQILNARNGVLEETVKIKDKEIEEIELKISKDGDIISLVNEQSDVLNEDNRKLKLNKSSLT